MTLLRVGRNVSDLPRLTAFYRDALGFTPGHYGPDPALAALLGAEATTQALHLGAQTLELTCLHPPGASHPGGTGADPWFQHIAIVTTAIEAAAQTAMQHGATAISDGVQRLPPEAGDVAAFKFRDPDGHPLELIQFPPGSQWDGAGYDHSAISVTDTAESIAFYTGMFGMPLTARQVNHGSAQDRLDGMRGVRVDVVALGQGTPHIELLGYHGAVAAPLWDVRDIAADRLVLQVADPAALAATLAAAGHTPVLQGNSVLVRDPSGHFLVGCPS